MKSTLAFVILASAFSALTGCTANTEAPATDTTGEEALTQKACVDILTLTCKAGYELSEDGCAQSHVFGAHPQGRCVKSPPVSDVCVDEETLTCETGYELSEDGCAQSHVFGAHPQGRCVKSPPVSDVCVDMETLTCATGFVLSEDGCAQSHVFGAHPQGRCVAQ